ncbi:MAG: hypothetical protein DME12_08135 [Candidatus Rokuibacteriota bacterium]|nr:MAG: hypothetical protein DME12_08135 [Candidatus Rokubacteria bacterium]
MVPFQLVHRAHAETHHWAPSSRAAVSTTCGALSSSGAAAAAATSCFTGAGGDGGGAGGGAGGASGAAGDDAGGRAGGRGDGAGGAANGAGGAGGGAGAWGRGAIDGVAAAMTGRTGSSTAVGRGAGRSGARGRSAGPATSLPRVAATVSVRPNNRVTLSSSTANFASSRCSRPSTSVSNAEKAGVVSRISAALSSVGPFGSSTAARISRAFAWHSSSAAKFGSSTWLMVMMRSRTARTRRRASAKVVRLDSCAVASASARTTASSALRPSIAVCAGAVTASVRAASSTLERRSMNSSRAAASSSISDSGGSTPPVSSSRAAWASFAASPANRRLSAARCLTRSSAVSVMECCDFRRAPRRCQTRRTRPGGTEALFRGDAEHFLDGRHALEHLKQAGLA